MTTSSSWNEGWYRFARRLDSPNFGLRPSDAKIDLIVLHSISLPPGDYTGTQVIDLFLNRLDWDAHPYFEMIRGIQVSAHFWIRRNGELWQFVSTTQRAWHAGQSSYRGRANCNDDSIGIVLEGLEGNTFEFAQYECLSGLCTALANLYPLSHIAGHEHIASSRKADPGSGFDWHRLQRDIAWPTHYFPQATLPPA